MSYCDLPESVKPLTRGYLENKTQDEMIRLVLELLTAYGSVLDALGVPPNSVSADFPRATAMTAYAQMRKDTWVGVKRSTFDVMAEEAGPLPTTILADTPAEPAEDLSPLPWDEEDAMLAGEGIRAEDGVDKIAQRVVENGLLVPGMSPKVMADRSYKIAEAFVAERSRRRSR